MKRYRMLRIFCLTAALFFAAAGCGDKKQVENEKSYRQIGINQLEKGEYDSAITAFDKALSQRKGKVTNLEEDINYYKAQAQIEAGRTQDGIDTYSALIRYNKKNSDAYYLRGCAYLSIDRDDEAVQDFSDAIRYEDDNGALYAAIYEQLMEEGLSDEADGYLAQGLKIKGKDGKAYLSRGRIYLAGGSLKKAEEELLKALEKGETEANLYLGQAAAAQDEAQEAKKYFTAYVGEHEQDADAYYELGRIALKEEDYAQALSYFTTGLECPRVSNRRGLWSGKIAAMEYTGDFAGAAQEMEAYLASYPKDEQAQREYVFLKTR